MTTATITDLPFAGLPLDAGGHFRLHLYGAVAGLIAHLRAPGLLDLSGALASFTFLRGYEQALDVYQPEGLAPADVRVWWDEQLARWEGGVAGHLPLRSLTEQGGLSRDEIRLLITAGLVEEDIRFGAVFAILQEPLPARRPCAGVLGWLLGVPDGPPADPWPALRALLDRGLLLAENRADPRAEWLMRVPPAVWDAVRGCPASAPLPGLTHQPAGDFPTLTDLVVPPALRREIARLPELLADGRLGAVVPRGMTGSGRRTVLGAVARALGRGVLLWDGGTPADETWRLLGPLATLTGAMPVIRCNPGPGETLDLPSLPGYDGPVGITLGRGGGLRGPLIERALSLVMPPPDHEARRRFWRASGVPAADADIERIAARFLLTGGLIHRAAPLARARAALDGREAISEEDVRLGARTLNRQALETLATPLEPAGGWGDLVLGAATTAELRSLESRCRVRELLGGQAGAAFAHGLNRGVRALFGGPSGTGKTLAARALAAALGMDLYRVDLAAVVNKYIGETERNLNQVLSRAEELDVLLLLDEGDALMTKRTEVRNANDRYANLETNYLLQRLETYEGIVVITTNAGSRIDPAFLRRIDVIIDFTPPEAAERLLIWRGHLPEANVVSPAFLEDIAVRCALTGGQIRNAALHATLLALGEGGAVSDTHLEASLLREYRKAGAAYPLRATPAAAGQVARLRRFASGLS